MFRIEKLIKDIEVILVKKDKYVLIVPNGHHLSNKTEVSLKDELFVVFNKGCDNKKYLTLSL